MQAHLWPTVRRRLFSGNLLGKGPLIHRTIYKHTPSGYEPIEEEINRYSLDRTGVVRTGFYVESILRTIDASGISKEDFQSTSDFNFFETETACGRLFKDTTITIIHYPNSVSHREVTSYTYNRSRVYSSLTNVLPPPLRIILPRFYGRQYTFGRPCHTSIHQTSLRDPDI